MYKWVQTKCRNIIKSHMGLTIYKHPMEYFRNWPVPRASVKHYRTPPRIPLVYWVINLLDASLRSPGSYFTSADPCGTPFWPNVVSPPNGLILQWRALYFMIRNYVERLIIWILTLEGYMAFLYLEPEVRGRFLNGPPFHSVGSN